MHHYLMDIASHLYCRLRHTIVISSTAVSFWQSLQAQKDLGFLMNPGEGPVTAVQLYVPPDTGVATHLFSGGADGTFAVWSAGPAWDCLKVCFDIEVILNVCCACENAPQYDSRFLPALWHTEQHNTLHMTLLNHTQSLFNASISSAAQNSSTYSERKLAPIKVGLHAGYDWTSQGDNRPLCASQWQAGSQHQQRQHTAYLGPGQRQMQLSQHLASSCRQRFFQPRWHLVCAADRQSGHHPQHWGGRGLSCNLAAFAAGGLYGMVHQQHLADRLRKWQYTCLGFTDRQRDGHMQAGSQDAYQGPCRHSPYNHWTTFAARLRVCSRYINRWGSF